MTMKAVLFDLDGTLLNRKKSLIKFVRWQVEGMLKTEITNQEKFVERFVELDANGYVWKDKVYDSLIKEFAIKGWTQSELLTSYELCFCAFSEPMEGVIEAVNAIKRVGLKIALVSNGKSPFQERNFNSLGISHLFDAVLVSESVGLRKPDIEIFKLTCSLLEVKASEAVFVGDSEKSDIEGASNAGIFSVFIPSSAEQQCHQANAVCSDYSTLLTIVQGASARHNK